MAKIMALVPCLMLPNNRDINKKSLVSNYELLGLDQFVIYDQCFEESDFDFVLNIFFGMKKKTVVGSL